MSEQIEQALSDAKSALELSSRVPYRALELANSALANEKASSYETNAYALAAKGAAYTSLGNYPDALRSLHQAMGLAFELRLTYVMAKIHQYRGWISHSQNQPVEAFSDWQSSLDYFRQVGRMDGVAWVLMHYAASYTTLGLTDHAIHCRISALNILEQNDGESSTDLAIALANDYLARAWSQKSRGNDGYAKMDAQVAIAIAMKAVTYQHSESLELAFHTIGEGFILLEHPKEAIRNLKHALECSLRSGGYRTESRIQGAIGLAYLNLGEVDSAVKILQNAISDAPQVTELEDLAMINSWLALAYQSNAEPIRAIEAHKQSALQMSKVQHQRSQWWGQMHDATIGLRESLIETAYVLEKEHEWLVEEFTLSQHSDMLDLLGMNDTLTGLLSQTTIISLAAESLPKEIAVIVEISNLAMINSRFERKTGDEVLRSVASIVSATLPSDTKIGRYSGNEFLVLFSDKDEESLDLIHSAVINFPWMAIDPDLNVKITTRKVNAKKPHLLAA
jgi:GGDEF domain-containing protein